MNVASGGLLLLLTLYLQGVWCSPVDVSLSLYQLITDVLKPAQLNEDVYVYGQESLGM